MPMVLAGCRSFQNAEELRVVIMLLLLEASASPRPIYAFSFHAALKRLLQLIHSGHPESSVMAGEFALMLVEVEMRDALRKAFKAS